MAKILIVEDDPNMRMGLKDNLEFDSYEVDLAEDGERGLKKAMENKYNLIILDVMLPKMSGFDVCKALRKGGYNTPIILLTAKGEEIDKVLGLELGADDYVTKPFSLRELLARIKAALRRGGEPEIESENVFIKIGRLSVNFAVLNAYVDGFLVPMTHKEYEALKYLWKKKNEVVSREELLRDVWGYKEGLATRTVDNFIVKLRQKIEEDPNNPQIIITVHGTGYKLIDAD